MWNCYNFAVVRILSLLSEPIMINRAIMGISDMARIGAVCLFLAAAAVGVCGEELVILQTNDTHSQIDPTDKGSGGIARRKVVVDSIRACMRMCCWLMRGMLCRALCFQYLPGGG